MKTGRQNLRNYIESLPISQQLSLMYFRSTEHTKIDVDSVRVQYGMSIALIVSMAAWDRLKCQEQQIIPSNLCKISEDMQTIGGEVYTEDPNGVQNFFQADYSYLK